MTAAKWIGTGTGVSGATLIALNPGEAGASWALSCVCSCPGPSCQSPPLT
jgi:hypothetical protein